MTSTVALVAQIGPILVGLAALWTALRTKKDTRQINNAVNHREPGEETLIELVVNTHRETVGIREDLSAHARKPADVAHPARYRR